jgi:hypothetical protein
LAVRAHCYSATVHVHQTLVRGKPDALCYASSSTWDPLPSNSTGTHGGSSAKSIAVYRCKRLSNVTDESHALPDSCPLIAPASHAEDSMHDRGPRPHEIPRSAPASSLIGSLTALFRVHGVHSRVRSHRQDAAGIVRLALGTFTRWGCGERPLTHAVNKRQPPLNISLQRPTQ